jgi:F-type H+-transporting ATPase subunit epsilon
MAETTKQLDVEVITPERRVLQVVADSVVLPAHDGELGVLNMRAPLMCELGIGQMRYRAGGQTERMFIDGGFAQVFHNRVTVLTNRALPAADVTPDVIAAEQRTLAGAGDDGREAGRQRLSALRSLAARA